MSTNAFARLKQLLPNAPLMIVRVVSVDALADTSVVLLPTNEGIVPITAGVQTGSTMYVRGSSVPAGQNAFVRNGVIESRAPDQPLVQITVGRVVPTFTPLAFSGPIADIAATVGTTVSVPLAPHWTDGIAPVRYSVASGSLPSGLALNGATGVLGGTYSTDGTADGVIFRASDAAGYYVLSNPVDFAGTLPPVPTDPYFANVGLLLLCDLASFVDRSTNAHTITNFGVTLDTANHYVGTASAKISVGGNDNRLQAPGHANLSATTQDFTIEMLVRFEATGTAAVLYQRATGTGYYPYQVYLTSGGAVGFRGFDSALSLAYSLVAATAVATNTWYFVQARRVGSTFALAINGSQVATVTVGGSPSLYSANDPTVVGCAAGTSIPVVGQMQMVRFTKNVGRAFTMIDAPFPTS